MGLQILLVEGTRWCPDIDIGQRGLGPDNNINAYILYTGIYGSIHRYRYLRCVSSADEE